MIHETIRISTGLFVCMEVLVVQTSIEAMMRNDIKTHGSFEWLNPVIEDVFRTGSH